jgi:hypothetical protein
MSARLIAFSIDIICLESCSSDSTSRIQDFVAKGGTEAEAFGRKCLCNALMADIGLAQTRGGVSEKTLITSGDDVADVARFLPSGATGYSAADVITRLLDTRV